MSETNEGPQAVDTTVALPVEAPAELQTETAQTEPAAPDASVKTDDETKSEPAPKRRAWWENVIAEARSNEREAKRERDAAMAELAKTRQPAPIPTTPETVAATEVERRATQIADERMFVETCNEIAETGAAKHADFDDAVRTYAMLGEMPKSFLEGITALGKDDGARVYYDLGKNPDEAARIFRLPPVKMAMELAKMAAVTPKVAAVSRVPDPIDPITSARVNVGAEPDPAKNPVEWTKWFNAERRKR